MTSVGARGRGRQVTLRSDFEVCNDSVIYEPGARFWRVIFKLLLYTEPISRVLGRAGCQGDRVVMSPVMHPGDIHLLQGDMTERV